MPIIKASSIRDLKNRIGIHEVVAPVVTLKKAGANYKGLSPFNQEKTPSFFISPDKNLYKCFSSGKAGDVISFVMETERLSFTEAVEALARRFGIQLEYEESPSGREERSLRQELLDLHETAAEHFRQTFLAADATGDFVRRYWDAERRFPPELAEEFKIGAAPPDDVGLGPLLRKKGHSRDALRQCGLFYVQERAGEDLLRPRFRGRLMIPIRDAQGRVIAFTARQLEITPQNDPSREAKYINSPETPLFTKSSVLFNLDRARLHASEKQPFVLVEGQLDALRCWHIGIRAVVAPQGTAITEHQLALLRRYAPRVECLLDGDAAGQQAALRFLPLALGAGLEAVFLILPGGADPDSLLQEQGLTGYEALRKAALPAMGFACRCLLPDPGSATPEEKSRAADALHELVAHAASRVARTEYLAEAARHLRLLPEALLHDHLDYETKQARRAARRAQSPRARSEEAAGSDRPLVRAHPGALPEEDLLLICLHFEELGKPLAAVLPLEWVDASHLAGRLLNRFLAEFEQDGWPGRDHLETLLEDPEEKTLVASVLFEPPGFEDPVKVANEGLRALHQRFLEPQINQIKLEIARKEENGEDDIVFSHKTLLELHKQLLSPPKLSR